AGNFNTASPTANFAVDTQAASETVSIDDVANIGATAAKADDTINISEHGLVTFTFSEQMDTSKTVLSASDVTLAHGTLGALSASTDGLSATAVLTAEASFAGTASVTLNAGALKDLAGNFNTASPTANFAVDTQAPSETVS